MRWNRSYKEDQFETDRTYFHTSDPAEHSSGRGIVRVFGIAGNLVLSKVMSADTQRMEVDLSGISSGLYVLSIEVNGERKFSERVSVIKQ